jgi:hypothetical protein
LVPSWRSWGSGWPHFSIRGYARHRGVSRTVVEKAIQQGRIRTLESGLIDAEEADRDWSRNTASKRESAQPSMAASSGSFHP